MTSLLTEADILVGRHWLADCTSRSEEADEILDTASTPDERIIAAIDRYYPGGWQALLQAEGA